jgi:dihydroorotase/N-acyl-D-amino-acid deacylase
MMRTTPAAALVVFAVVQSACSQPATCPAAPAPSAPPLDVILTNGRVVDGTGAPWFRADVGIAGGRIAAIGDLSGSSAGRRIDVHGDVVAPGFIDMLGQSELYVLIDNRVESKIRQGITTEITGEGHDSVAPTSDTLIGEQRPLLDRFHLTIDWRDVAGYRRRFEANRSTINLGTYVGAANARAVVLGLGMGDPTPAQLAAMEGEVERAMEQGALGLSSELIYPPDSYEKTAELVALARVAARHGGIYATHMRDEGDEEAAALDEVFTIAREAKIPVEIFHLKVAGRNNWGKMKDVVQRIERARAEGIDVTADMYPYPAASNDLAANVPTWATDGGVDRMIARFHEPAVRERIKAELWNRDHEDPADILLVSGSNPSLTRYMGKRLSEVAKEMSRSPEDALLDVVEADRATTMVVRFLMREDDVTLGLAQPWVSLDCDNPGQAIDGPLARELAHPRAFGSAPRLLGHYARDERLFSLEEAVRKMTSLPARRLRLADRGLLRPGMAADVTVFDAARIHDVATFEAPLRYSEGVDWVLVNGQVVLDDGKLTEARPGKFLAR